jgi:hypothetical protein
MIRLLVLALLLACPQDEGKAPKKGPASLEEETQPGTKPESWAKAVTALQKAIDVKSSASVGSAAKEVGGYDSAETATKLISSYLQCVKQLEAEDKRQTRRWTTNCRR